MVPHHRGRAPSKQPGEGREGLSQRVPLLQLRPAGPASGRELSRRRFCGVQGRRFGDPHAQTDTGGSLPSYPDPTRLTVANFVKTCGTAVLALARLGGGDGGPAGSPCVDSARRCWRQRRADGWMCSDRGCHQFFIPENRHMGLAIAPHPLRRSPDLSSAVDPVTIGPTSLRPGQHAAKIATFDSAAARAHQRHDVRPRLRGEVGTALLTQMLYGVQRFGHFRGRGVGKWRVSHPASGLSGAGSTVNLADQLLTSDEPSIRLQIRLGVEGPTEAQVTDLKEQVRRSSRVAALGAQCTRRNR
jgi:hypothetical protein